MGLRVGTLRFLAFHRDVSRTSHYIRFKLPKKNWRRAPDLRSHATFKAGPALGVVESVGETHISRRLARVSPCSIDCHECSAAHGTSGGDQYGHERFLSDRELLPCQRVFQALGYSEAVGTVLGLICTEAETEEVVLDDTTWYVALGERHLPQGAPTSPAD